MANVSRIWRSQLTASRVGSEYSQASEADLLAAARNSDGCAFAELCRRYAAPVQRRLFRMLRNREDAEDVMQDAICRAFMNLKRFRGTCTFCVWFTQIAINSALMSLRKRRVRSELSYDCQPNDTPEGQWEFPDKSPNAEQVCMRRQAIERMSLAVDKLPPRYRELVRQFHGTEQSLKETAENLGLKVSTAKARLLRARLKMRVRLSTQKISFADACR